MNKLLEQLENEVVYLTKETIKEYLIINKPINKKLLNRFVKMSPDVLNETAIRIVRNSKHINETKEELYLIKDLLDSGDTVFGKHKSYSLNSNPEGTVRNSLMTGIMTENNLFVSLFDIYGFADWQYIICKDDQWHLDMVLPKDESVSKFIKFIESLGYHCKEKQSAIQEFIFLYANNPEISANLQILNKWTYVRIFEKTPKDESAEILKCNRYAYHYTTKERIAGILETGIHCDNLSHPNYPKRAFMLITNRSDLIDKKMLLADNGRETSILDFDVQSIALKRKIAVVNRIPIYNIEEVVIDLTKLPDDYGLYYDVNTPIFGIFTDKDIPAYCIVGSPYYKK